MSLVIQNLVTFLMIIISAIFVENTIFARGFGVSRMLNIMTDSSVDKLIFCSLVTLINVLAAPLAFFVNVFLAKPSVWYREYIRPLSLVLCAIVAFFVVLFVVFLIKPENIKSILKALPMATFNCAVLGPLLISSTQKYSFVQTIAFALGSGIAYGLAVLLLTEGQRKIDNRKVATAFKGLPINLIYIGILALALFGLTGHGV